MRSSALANLGIALRNPCSVLRTPYLATRPALERAEDHTCTELPERAARHLHFRAAVP